MIKLQLFDIIKMMDWLVKPKQKVKYQGKYNFQLSLNTQHVDSSSTISITCFTDKSQRAAVPCNYIWFIIKNGLPQEVSNFKGCTFICDTSYIGYYVQAHIISNDADFSGKAIVTFGPVQLDVSLKTGILNSLSTGLLELPVFFVSPEQEQKQGTIQLYESQIKLIHNFSEANYIFDYSIVEPQIVANPREVTKASIIFSQKYQSEMRRFQKRLFSYHELTSSKSSYMNLSKSNLRSTASTGPLRLEIKFHTRQSRDTFFFTVKTFIAKRQLKNSAIIRKIENINFEKEEDFNAILQLDNLKCDLIRYDKLYKQIQMEKRKLLDQKSQMERDSQRGRGGDLSMNANYLANTRREDPIMISKMNKLEETNMELKMKIVKLNNQLDQARGNASVIMKPQMFLSPFSKRKEDDNESLVGLLDDLSRCDPEKQIDRLQQEKKALEIKLEKSFEKISILQNKLVKTQNAIPSQTNSINFTYNKSLQSNGQSQKYIQNLKVENESLHKLNSILQAENNALNARIEKQARNLYKNQNKIQSHLTKIREQNRTTDLLIETKVQQEKIAKLTEQIGKLKTSLKAKQQQLQKTLQKCIHLQRRVKDTEMELEMHRKNQDVLNRSQHMSMQMENYNQEQIKMLKEHNDFLIEENEKLVKACEKYMADAKQNNALRKEIIQLKERISQMRTNPESFM